MRDYPGHSFDLDTMEMVYISNMESKRQLVESSLIATTTNCNLRVGDHPVCKLTAPIIIQALHLAPKTASPLQLPSTPPASPLSQLPPTLPASSSADTAASAPSTPAPPPLPLQPLAIASHLVNPITPAPSPVGPPAARTRHGRARNTALFNKNRIAPYVLPGSGYDDVPSASWAPVSSITLSNSQPSATFSHPTSSSPLILTSNASQPRRRGRPPRPRRAFSSDPNSLTPLPNTQPSSDRPPSSPISTVLTQPSSLQPRQRGRPPRPRSVVSSEPNSLTPLPLTQPSSDSHPSSPISTTLTLPSSLQPRQRGHPPRPRPDVLVVLSSLTPLPSTQPSSDRPPTLQQRRSSRPLRQRPYSTTSRSQPS